MREKVHKLITEIKKIKINQSKKQINKSEQQVIFKDDDKVEQQVMKFCQENRPKVEFD